MYEDEMLIELYWQRDEAAIRETDRKYHRYCRSIACHITENDADAEECVYDTWLRAWNTIPPKKPDVLKLFLARLTRNLALDRLRKESAAKRNGGYALFLDELAECIPSQQDPEKELAEHELASRINRFLRSQSSANRALFLRRYFYHEPYAEIAESVGINEASIRQTVSRMRRKLKTELEKEGYLS